VHRRASRRVASWFRASIARGNPDQHHSDRRATLQSQRSEEALVEKHSLLNEASIEAWVAEREPDGYQKLADAVALGRITGARARSVRVFLEGRSAATRALMEQVDRELARRGVEAAEASAVHAATSSRWAKLSMLVALGALVVSAWPFIEQRLK